MKNNSQGFTLIELMITITILGTLTVLTAQTIQQSIKSKVKLQDQVDDVSHLRDAMRLIERDINLAYHYQDVEKEIYELVKKQNTTGTQQAQQAANPAFGGFGQPPIAQQPQSNIYGAYDPFASTRELKRKDPSTNFIGAIDSVNFPTSNNARYLKNSLQADVIEVGYTLKECKSLKEGSGTSKCIWRRSGNFVDDDVTKGGDEVVLLENVTEFKLRYIGKGKQEWVDAWRSDEGGDAVTKKNFPEAVEVSITIEKKQNGKAKKYSMQNIIPLHFPNNLPSTNNSTGGINGSTQGGAQNPWQTAPPTTQ